MFHKTLKKGQESLIFSYYKQKHKREIVLAGAQEKNFLFHKPLLYYRGVRKAQAYEFSGTMYPLVTFFFLLISVK